MNRPLVSTGEDGVVTVTTENAEAEFGGIGYITVENDEQVVKVHAELEDEGSIVLTVIDTATDETQQEKTVVGAKDVELSVPAGEYAINFETSEGTTGNLTVSVE